MEKGQWVWSVKWDRPVMIVDIVEILDQPVVAVSIIELDSDGNAVLEEASTIINDVTFWGDLSEISH